MEIFNEIKKINLPEKKFVIVGSAILQIKNIREANDLDILVSKNVYDQFKKRVGWKLIERNPPGREIWEFIQKNNIQMYFRFYGVQEYNLDYFFGDPSRTECIKGIYFTSLAELIRSKSEWSRPKDVIDINLIEKYFMTLDK